jgi:hypothetical protein
MNWNKFFFAFITAFVFLFVFGFLWYATLMHNAHREVQTLLRPEADFKSYFGWLALGQFVMAFFFTLLCARYVPSGRAGAGAMLGVLVGLVYAGPHLISVCSPTINVENPLPLDRRRCDPIHSRRRNRRGHL